MLVEPRSSGLRMLAYAVGLALFAVGVVLALWGTPHRSAPTTAPPTTLLPPAPTVVPSGEAAGDVWFEETAQQSGIDFWHTSGAGGGWHMPEIMSGGVCILDYDRDGRLDVYFVTGGRIEGADETTPTNKLYRNLGDGKFADATKGSGTTDRGYGMGCTTGDYDNDGWTDLYVTNAGPNILYRNRGDGTFENVTAAAGVGDPAFSSSAVFADYDQDGDLDLYVANYVLWTADSDVRCTSSSGQPDYCTPNAYRARHTDTLYRNEGNGTFSDVSEASGITSMTGNGLGVVACDFSADGRLDFAVANDLTPNQLWINQGDGTFRDESLERGVAYSAEGMAQAGMGLDARDVDEDGDFDLYITHFAHETNTLYIDEGDYFTDATTRFGLNASRPFTGFGTGIIDFNHDGRRDIYVANGRVARTGQTHFDPDDPYAEPSQLFEQLPDGMFREVLPRGGTARLLIRSARGAAFADYDEDGDVDIFVANRDGPAWLLKNLVGSRGNWIMLRVVNEHGSDAIGARVTIEYEGRKRIDDVRPGYSYTASSDPRVHFGLGDVRRVDAVTVVWPGGLSRKFSSLDANHVYELKPDGTSQRVR